MAGQDIIFELKKWFKNSEPEEFLRVLAYRISRKLIFKKLDSLLPGYPYEPDNERLINDLISELTIFLLENKRFQKGIMERKEPFNAGSFLELSFIRNLIDKARCPQKDPKRYLHHRIYEVLNNSSQFFLSKDEKNYSMFSMSQKSKKLYGLSDEVFDQIDFPFHIVTNQTYENINTKKNIEHLTRYFWEAVSAALNGTPVPIYIRDFVNWIEFHVEFKNHSSIKNESGLNYISDTQVSQDKEYYLKKWAKHFIYEMDEKEKAVFFLHQCMEMKLKSVSAELGYSGPSGSKYLFDKASDKLRKFIMENDLTYLSKQDLDKKCFSIFINFLCRNLKKSVSMP